ncbi:cytochrome bd-I ubiquinol oxidase subunit 2 apoprotein [Filimonas lacunae]|uniref:Cytochrome bd-I ubiquinol oxidase subunit 2 apoprotein n=1 Tax=Filimonas lacunae TaxID=477680 RepID=A0A173MAF1_9BACT|nr:cytochrome d ubiquinol oxidase subunit II [Filimonas lacunae]BAV04489.1 cytochrome d ubiquinol oxidase subunit II [Filimonas lacunae]SIT31567.1 cytochrome bd-I ubiquinol oxidase subunit 2 apoprotein [Filimonas lacunae]
MLYVIICFLWASIWLYLLLGGADFGAGILELFTSKGNRDKTRDTMYQAIGPVWEANHMWLIIAIVILFVGFPVIYSTMSVYLHIPLTVMLLGIIARGTAFAFRHYDAVVDDMQVLYNRIFTWSSLITPLFLGIIAGSTVSSTINPDANNFLDAYVFSWLSFFSVAVGLFTVAICAFLAAIYLIGETNNDTDKKRFISKARIANIAAVIFGGMVFTAAWKEGIPLVDWIFGNAVGIAAITAASLSLVLLWYLLLKGKTKVLRILAGFQVTMILITTTFKHFPNIVILKGGGHLSLMEHHGHDKTLQALGMALLLGSLFILPALFYLIYSFQKKTAAGTDHHH